MIKKMVYPEKIEKEHSGVEVATIVKQEDGNQLSCVSSDKANPIGWGIMIADLLRQTAISLELNGLTLDDRFLKRDEIERTILRVVNDELAKPSSPITQAGETEN